MAKNTQLTVPEKIKQYCNLFSVYNVKEIIFDYDGSGDSGDFECATVVIGPDANAADKLRNEISQPQYADIANATRDKTISFNAFISERRAEKNPLVTPEICEEISEDVFTFLPGGWEINDGSYGTITIDVTKKKITVEHNERITDIRSESFEY